MLSFMRKIEYTSTEPFAPDTNGRGTLADLVLDARMIPPCGLIPPFRVVASLLDQGGEEVDGGGPTAVVHATAPST